LDTGVEEATRPAHIVKRLKKFAVCRFSQKSTAV